MGRVVLIFLLILVSSPSADGFLGNLLGGLLGGVGKIATGVLGGVGSIVGGVVHGVGSIACGVAQGANNLVNGVAHGALGIVHGVGSAVGLGGVTGAVGGLAGGIANGAHGLVGGTLNAVCGGGAIHFAVNPFCGIFCGASFPNVNKLQLPTFGIPGFDFYLPHIYPLISLPSFMLPSFHFPKINLDFGRFPHLRFPDFSFPGFPWLKFGHFRNPLSILALVPRLPRGDLLTYFHQQFPKGVQLQLVLDNSLNLGLPEFEFSRALIIGLISNFPLSANYQIRLHLINGINLNTYTLRSLYDIPHVVGLLGRLRFSGQRGLDAHDIIGILNAATSGTSLQPLNFFLNPFPAPRFTLPASPLPGFKPWFINFNIKPLAAGDIAAWEKLFAGHLPPFIPAKVHLPFGQVPDFRVAFTWLLPAFSAKLPQLFIPSWKGFTPILGSVNGLPGIYIDNGVQISLPEINFGDLKWFQWSFPALHFPGIDLSYIHTTNLFNLVFPANGFKLIDLPANEMHELGLPIGGLVGAVNGVLNFAVNLVCGIFCSAKFPNVNHLQLPNFRIPGFDFYLPNIYPMINLPNFMLPGFQFPQINLDFGRFPHLKFPDFSFPAFPWLKFGHFKNPLSILSLVPRLPRGDLFTYFQRQFPNGIQLQLVLDNSLNLGLPSFELSRALIIGLISNFPFSPKFQIRVVLINGKDIDTYTIRYPRDIPAIIAKLGKLRFSGRDGLDAPTFFNELNKATTGATLQPLNFLFNPFPAPQFKLPTPSVSFKPWFINYNIRPLSPIDIRAWENLFAGHRPPFIPGKVRLPAGQVPSFRVAFTWLLPEFSAKLPHLFIPSWRGFRPIISSIHGFPGIQIDDGVEIALPEVEVADLKVTVLSFPALTFPDIDLTRVRPTNTFNLEIPAEGFEPIEVPTIAGQTGGELPNGGDGNGARPGGNGGGIRPDGNGQRPGGNGGGIRPDGNGVRPGGNGGGIRPDGNGERPGGNGGGIRPDGNGERPGGNGGGIRPDGNGERPGGNGGGIRPDGNGQRPGGNGGGIRPDGNGERPGGNGGGIRPDGNGGVRPGGNGGGIQPDGNGGVRPGGNGGGIQPDGNGGVRPGGNGGGIQPDGNGGVRPGGNGSPNAGGFKFVCPAGYTAQGRTCVGSGGTVKCPTGYTLESGVCTVNLQIRQGPNGMYISAIAGECIDGSSAFGGDFEGYCKITDPVRLQGYLKDRGTNIDIAQLKPSGGGQGGGNVGGSGGVQGNGGGGSSVLNINIMHGPDAVYISLVGGKCVTGSDSPGEGQLKGYCKVNDAKSVQAFLKAHGTNIDIGQLQVGGG